jgi:hypothetical protein
MAVLSLVQNSRAADKLNGLTGQFQHKKTGFVCEGAIRLRWQPLFPAPSRQ